MSNYEISDKKYRIVMLVLVLIQAFLLFWCLAANGVAYANDTPTYEVPARSLLSDGILLDTHGNPILSRTPGYIWFLALVWKLIGYNELAIVIIQIFMVLAMTIMISYLVKEISHKNILGCIASLFYICDAAVYGYCRCILTDTMFPFLLVLSLLMFYKYLNNKKILYFTLSVFFLNYAMLVRPQIMYYNMIIALVSIILFIIKKLRWKECLIYLLIFTIAYGGWSLRNLNVNGEAMFSSIRDISYYRFYAPEIYSIKESVSTDEAQEVFSKKLMEKYPNYDELTLIEQVHAEKDIGKSYIDNHIVEYLIMNIKGLFSEMVAPGLIYISLWNLPHKIYLVVVFSVAGILLLSYCIYALGFLKNIKRWTFWDWLILLTVMYLMASTAVLGNSRYRMAFYPLSLIGTFTCWKKLGGLDKKTENLDYEKIHQDNEVRPLD